MPVGTGYWIDPIGNIVLVMEHLSYIKSHPEDFGYTPSQVRKISRRDRGKILKKAMQDGWIRIRVDRQHVPHIEFWRLDEWTHAAISGFLQEEPSSLPVVISELSRNEYYETDVEGIRARELAFMNPEEDEEEDD